MSFSCVARQVGTAKKLPTIYRPFWPSYYI